MGFEFNQCTIGSNDTIRRENEAGGCDTDEDDDEDAMDIEASAGSFFNLFEQEGDANEVSGRKDA